MTRRDLVTTVVGAGAAAAGLGLAWWTQTGTPPAALPTGDDLAWWQTRFQRPEGGDLALADFKGQRLLLNFWATWCAPCVKEMPMLDAFASTQRVHGWQVIGLAMDDVAAVRSFLKRVPVGFPVGIAGVDGLDMSRALGNSKSQLPFTTVWDTRAKLLHSKLGALTEDDLSTWAASKME